MNKQRILKVLETIRPLLIVYLIIAVVFLCFVAFIAYPLFYNWVLGESVVNKHITEILGNETDHHIAVPILLDWLKNNVYYPTEKDALLAQDNGWGLYWIDDKPRIFHRGIPASWVIKSKLGRCGEDSTYFVEIMRELGYEARRVTPEGWDHAWAEFYTPSGVKIYVDPSAFRVIDDPIKFASGVNWTNIWAENINGTKENVSSEYRI